MPEAALATSNLLNFGSLAALSAVRLLQLLQLPLFAERCDKFRLCSSAAFSHVILAGADELGHGGRASR